MILLAAAAAALFAWLPGWVEEGGLAGVGGSGAGAVAGPEAPPASEARPAGEVDGAPGTDSTPSSAPPSQPVPEASSPPSHDRRGGRISSAASVDRGGVRGGPSPRGPGPSIDGEDPSDHDPTEEPFRRAMSEGLAALEGQEWEAAGDAFRRAQELRPGAAEAADGLARAETAGRRERLAELQERAQALEEGERWAEALVVHQRALEIDPTVTFARRGAERSGERARLDQALGFHLDHPDRFQSAEVRREAEALLDRALAVEPAGPKLQRQRRRLGEQLEAWSRPVQARLVSDDRTEVTVFRVGEQGTFEQRELTLTPGTYTVLGRRPGYREVRRQLVVHPGESPEPLRVVCEEEI